MKKKWLHFVVCIVANARTTQAGLLTLHETCEKLDVLKANHGEAHIKNSRKIKRNGIEGFLNGQKHWYVKAKEV